MANSKLKGEPSAARRHVTAQVTRSFGSLPARHRQVEYLLNDGTGARFQDQEFTPEPLDGDGETASELLLRERGR
ncbi:MAG: hypothetical protein IPI35_18855 [Deltaproteobacteria bacterium]|nr:hypothetical protein [Deltaproteobacteria bacterium]